MPVVFDITRRQRRNRRRNPTAPHYTDVTLRNFSGGLNRVDQEKSMNTTFARVLDNFSANNDGSVEVRWGTKMVKELADHAGLATTDIILDMVYFADKLVVVTTTGLLATYDYTTGDVEVIWNDAIANALVGAPDGWTPGLAQVDFTEFRNQLVVCNGVDKPIIIDDDHTVDYLQDIPTGSNVFTPIGKYCTTVGNYVVIAGIPAAPGEIYISSAGSSGTWPGDAAPNDAISINVDAYAATTGGEIIGISSFRKYLLVHFAKATVVFELGIYDDAGNHTPEHIDVINDFGLLSHRTIVVLAKELVLSDGIGTHSAQRNLLSSLIEANALSHLIRPDYVAAIPQSRANQLKCFSTYNKLDKRISTYIFDGTDWQVFTFTFKEGLKARDISWATHSGWAFTSGTNTALGRVFFSKGSRIYLYGNSVFTDEDYSTDFIDDFETEWATATPYEVGDLVREAGVVYKCMIGHVSGVFASDLGADLWEPYMGEPIPIDWEMPWTDTNKRLLKKQLGPIQIDSSGAGTFTLQIFVDNIYKDADDDYDPAVELDFTAGDSPGYGDVGTQPYGAGRRTDDERPWDMPVEFKIIKLRVVGSTTEHFAINAIALPYKRGTYRR